MGKGRFELPFPAPRAGRLTKLSYFPSAQIGNRTLISSSTSLYDNHYTIRAFMGSTGIEPMSSVLETDRIPLPQDPKGQRTELHRSPRASQALVRLPHRNGHSFHALREARTLTKSLEGFYATITSSAQIIPPAGFAPTSPDFFHQVQIPSDVQSPVYLASIRWGYQRRKLDLN